MKTMENRRVLGVIPASAIVISSMIGTGIFTTTGLMVAMGAKGGDILLGWLIGGVIALSGALCYGEIGAHLPASGGEYHYLSRLLHPAAGFISGWVSLIVGFAAPIAASAMAMHLYVATIFPNWPVRQMAAVTILLFALLHSYDLRLGSQVQTIMIVIKLFLLLVFVFGILLAAPSTGSGSPMAFNPAFWTSSSFAVVLVFISFAYSGWNAASYIGAEIDSPERNLPRALIWGAGSVTFLYFVVNLVFLRSVELEQLSGVEEVGYVVAAAVWGPSGGQAASTFIALTLVAPISAMLLTGPRVAEAMARDGFLPGWFGKLNDRNVPSFAIFFQATLAVIIVLTSSFTALLIYIGFTLNLFAALTVISSFRLRRSSCFKYRTCISYPLAPIIFTIFSIWITIWSIHSQPVSTLTGIATLSLGYIAYLFSPQRSKAVIRKHQ